MTQQLIAPKNEHSVRPKSEKLELSWFNIFFFAAFHIIAIVAAPFCFSWSALGVAFFLHWLTGSIGICLAYHRILTHRSLEVPKWLERVLVTCGALALQGGPIFWVAGHNLHHAHTEDNEKDPYSAKKGFWWSHMGWLMYKQDKYFDYDQYKRYAVRADRDPYYRWLEKNFILVQIALGLLLLAIGGWSWVVYGVFVRAVTLWHCTWFVNSATHFWGYKNFECEDGSLNLWWVGVLAYGEGWHNNHHFNPRVAKAGQRWWEVDVTWYAIQVLRALGLAKKVVM